MTVYTLGAGMPEITLPGESVIRFEAISPTTGAAITSVEVTQLDVYGIDRSGTTGALLDEIPLITPEELEGNYD